MNIFLNKFEETELDDITTVLKSGELGFGPNVPILEDKFRPFSRKAFNVATSSASAAAFIIFAYLKEKYGKCDVYTPSLGFSSPVWAARYLGHNVIFVEVNDELLFNSGHYRKIRATGSNKAVLMPILYGGISEINDWNPIGDEFVVVDSAHCVTPKLECDCVFFSFHPYKPICCSDGGMMAIDCADIDEYSRLYRNFGRKNTNTSYDITQDGFKFYMNNLNATIALTHIKKYRDLLASRKENHRDLSRSFKLLPHDPSSSYYFSTSLTDRANELLHKFGLSRHYPLLHQTSVFKNGVALPHTEGIHRLILNLPLYQKLKPQSFGAAISADIP